MMHSQNRSKGFSPNARAREVQEEKEKKLKEAPWRSHSMWQHVSQPRETNLQIMIMQHASVSFLCLQILFNPSYTYHTMHSIFNPSHRFIKLRQCSGKVVHHQSNPSHLSCRPPRLHPTQLLKQFLRFALPP